ncbi:hypothetical protein [Actinoplanes philippinensis]|uniref:hypothetical protein n=1 Tax=Actinoplanes philippinensis TaxID=35752 RepID=UPI0033FE0A4D
MTMHDDDRAGDDGSRTAPPALVRPKRSRLKTVAGVAGLAAVLGAGSYLTTTWVLDDDGETKTQDVAAIGQPAQPDASSPTAAASAPGSASPAPTMAGQAVEPADEASPTPTKDAKSVEEEIKAAREKAAKDGYPLRRALQPAKDVAQPVGEVEVTNEGQLGTTGKTLRVVAAHYDLTGQRELLWAAGNDERKVGKATCTQTFKFSNEGAPVKRPTMLSCWRTSKEKSVVAIAVVREGRPDARETVTELNKKWDSMN